MEAEKILRKILFMDAADNSPVEFSVSAKPSSIVKAMREYTEQQTAALIIERDEYRDVLEIAKNCQSACETCSDYISAILVKYHQ